MTLKLCSIAVALALGGAAQAQTPAAADRKAYNAQEDRIEAQAKAAKEKCDSLDGNAKDVCEKQAEAQEKIAKAELAAKANPSQRNQRKAAEARIDGEYEVAKEKCDDQKGEQKDACEKQAKDTRDQARADVKQQYAQRRSGERAASGATRSTTSK